MSELLLFALATSPLAAVGCFVGRRTRTVWAILWPLAAPLALAVVGVTVHVLSDKTQCIEGCEIWFAFLPSVLVGPPALVWVVAAGAARLSRRAVPRRGGRPT